MIFFGIAISIVCIATAVIITIAIYLTLYRKFNGHKLLTVGTMASVFVIVAIIHAICIATSYCYSNGISDGFSTIYSILGALTFEGQNPDNYNIENVTAICFYYGSVAYLGISNALLIAIGISYPFYCQFSKLLTIKKTNLYIFTYVTQESLYLANSIIDNDSTVKIIFSSDEIETFDKTNPIHYEIMQRRYLYLPLSKNDKNNKKKTKRLSIIKRLFRIRWKSKIINNKIYIFALKTENINRYGYESKNSDIVFDDMNSLVDGKCALKLLKKGARNIVINYFILSNHDTNYEFYQKKINELPYTFNRKNKDNKSDSKPSDKVSIFCFNLNILNDATMSAENLIDVRHNNLEKDKIVTTLNNSSYINYMPEGHHSLIIGFGMKGQAALNYLYLDNNGGYMENNMFIPTKFTAEIIDKNMDAVIAPFISMHPSYVFKNLMIENNKITNPLNKGDVSYNNLRNHYNLEGEQNNEKFEYLLKYMAFPHIFYSKLNFYDPKFLNVIKNICERKYDSIAICLGDDEENIKCANTILQTLRQSIVSNKNEVPKKLQIFVNIWDANNNGRLNWNMNSNENWNHVKNVFVYTFGNNTKIYSYDLLDNKGGALINHAYDKINNPKCKDLSEEEMLRQYYREVSIYKRTTNKIAYKYKSIYEQYLNETKTYNLLKKDFDKYSKLDTIDYGNEIYFNDAFIDAVNKEQKSELINNGILNEKGIKSSLANYDRIRNCKDKDLTKSNLILDENKEAYHWRYLIQYEHSRWCRFEMLNGTIFINKLSNNDDKKTYQKESVKVHDSILPYSKFTNFWNIKLKDNYLPINKEDYDYAIVVAALRLDVKANKKEK